VKLRSLHARLTAGVGIWTFTILIAILLIGHLAAVRHPAHVWLLHDSLLTLSGVVLVTAGVSVIRRGLSPFRVLRDRLAAVREGRSPRLEGEYPTEVVPLVDDLNGLLEERERRVARAVAKAGGLAHGL